MVEEKRGRLKSSVNQTKSNKTRVRTEYQNKDREVKRRMRKDKRRWVNDLALSAEKAAGSGMKELYEITKTLCNDRSKAVNAVKD